jgi:hypothetical protein
MTDTAAPRSLAKPFVPADVRHGQEPEPFDWDRLLASLKAWDEAERAVFQAHIQMIDDVSAALGGDARKLRERG